MSQPDCETLANALEQCSAIKWSGVLYRSASPRYANKDDLLSGSGSKTAGARWNPPNSFRAIYASLDPHSALDEALAHFKYYGISMANAMPRVIVSLEARVRRVLDLTSASIRRLLDVSEKQLLDEPWRKKQREGTEALTQSIGRLAFDAAWEGILVRSAARRGGKNLIIFPGNLCTPKSWIRITNVSELPRRS